MPGQLHKKPSTSTMRPHYKGQKISEPLIKHPEKPTDTRINKFLSETGFCSRRKADELVAKGEVFINGRKAVMGDKIPPGAEVRVGNKLLTQEQESIYLALNKPVGITCTTDLRIHGNIISFINYPKRVFPIGRLDKDSQGLILLTNDGDIVNKILRGGNHHEKEYLVTVNKPINEAFLKGMAKGVFLKELEQTTRPCTISQEGPKVFRIILTQGLNRQIRRMCEAFGFTVTKLQRLRIMNIELGSLKIGSYRNLTKEELLTLGKLIQHSYK